MARKANTAKSDESRDNEAQLRFLFAAMQDAQGVIRATDTKVVALLAALVVPLTKLSKIWSVCRDFLAALDGFSAFCGGLLILTFSAAWILSFCATVRTLFHVDNPSEHVDGDKPTGCFYAPSLFKVSLRDVFTPRRLDSTAQFHQFFAQLPTTDYDVRRELTFEHMKLVYIRTVKLARAGVAYAAFVIWFSTGGAIWLSTLFIKSYGS